MKEMTAVILAAGQGTRMKSDYPKVLHSVCGVPMVKQVIRVATESGFKKCVVITGFKEKYVREAVGDIVTFVHQEKQLGTAHAVMQAVPEFKDDKDGYILVVCGDTPLLKVETVKKILNTCVENNAAATVLTAVVDNPFGYGRIIRDKNGNMKSIVEQKDGTPEELKIKEINTGTYIFHVETFLEALSKVSNENAQNEYYLTDVFEIMISEGKKVIPVITEQEETLGVNTRQQLSQAEKILRLRKLDELMTQGVTVIDAENTYVEQDVKVGKDTIIYPGTILQGSTEIGEKCIIGPETQLKNVKCGNNCNLNRVYAIDSVIGNDNNIGPFVHIRPGTEIENNVKLGNFVEVKNSTIKSGTKLPHLIYCGDADLGENVNFGCGTVTVNFDGKEKHRTVVEDHAFIGCNTNLVAPVRVGKRAFTAAGSTITEDVPENSLAIARQRQKNIKNWVKKGTYKDDLK